MQVGKKLMKGWLAEENGRKEKESGRNEPKNGKTEGRQERENEAENIGGQPVSGLSSVRGMPVSSSTL